MPDDTSTDDGTGTDAETLTLTLDIELDEIHTEMLGDVLATAPDRETLTDALARELAAHVEREGAVETMIYQARQGVAKQQQQVGQQLAQADGGVPGAPVDEGDTDTDEPED